MMAQTAGLERVGEKIDTLVADAKAHAAQVDERLEAIERQLEVTGEVAKAADARADRVLGGVGAFVDRVGKGLSSHPAMIVYGIVGALVLHHVGADDYAKALLSYYLVPSGPPALQGPQ